MVLNLRAVMNVLFTNDDGIEAPGLRALIDNIPKGVTPLVAAPAGERSASSHSISLGQQLEIEEFTDKDIRYYRIYGTPADCVKFAFSEIEEFSPDLVVSGINQGANTGVSVYYSGTISAAREGLINGIPSIAVSLCNRSFADFRASVRITNQLIEGYLSRSLPSNMLLNVNVPPLPPEKLRGLKVTKQAASRFVEEFVAGEGEEGKRIYTLAGEIEIYDKDGTSDEEAVSGGYISLTPLRLDLTDYRAMAFFENWQKRQ